MEETFKQKPTSDSEAFPRYLFHEGTNTQAYRYLGAHYDETGHGVFRVWAPHAAQVYVVGEFNDWDEEEGMIEMHCYPGGVWEGKAEGLYDYMMYRYLIITKDGRHILKSDPYGFHMENRPSTSSKLYRLEGYAWGDEAWCAERETGSIYQKPVNIYEIHAGSWRTYPDGKLFSYRKLADELIPYVLDMGYTHIELMPLAEYPLDASWGYQVIGYYAPTSRYGTPKDLMYLVDQCHQHGIGVILDWVPAHFPRDMAGLSDFDGEALYEHPDPMRGSHPQWGTKIFDYGRTEVKSFLISNALYWAEMYHIDGLRVDAVASMLYLNFGREAGQWRPNKYGGDGNLEAIALLKDLNKAMKKENPGVMMIAEESTSWPHITGDAEDGLGFTFKWNMGWMNDMLKYIAMDPVFRSHHHNSVTFSMTYAYSEHFVLPLSHDEVVHGKRSLVNKWEDGPYEEKFANLRAFYGYTMAHPGKKLLFMGSEFAQFIEWKFDQGLDWLLLDYELHRKMQAYVKALNHFYKSTPAFYANDENWNGFSWINCDDKANNILSLRRIADDGEEIVVVVNFSPVVRVHYRLGVYQHAMYHEVLNSDDVKYGGSGIHNPSTVRSEEIPKDGYECSLEITVPGLSCVYFKPGRKLARVKKKEEEKRKRAEARARNKVKKAAAASKSRNIKES